MRPTSGGRPTGPVKADTEKLAAFKAAGLAMGVAQYLFSISRLLLF
jgi:hypothetical protein